MKKNIFSKLIFVLLILLLSACKSKTAPISKDSALSHEGHAMGTESAKEKKILYYVDPMHPWYKSDKPGIAPDCGMKLVPVYEDVQGMTETAPSADLGRAPLSIGEAKQQLIGVKAEAVTRQALKREINATGRVAFDPDLYVAQSEYLIARHTGGGSLEGLQGQLVKAARSRLQLLGMSDDQIRELEKKGQAQGSLVLGKKGEPTWIYGSIFESELPWVKAGTPVEVVIPGTTDSYNSTISSVDPTVNPNTRSAQVRVRLSNVTGYLRPDMYVKLKILAENGNVLAIPDSAVIHTGKREIAFVEIAAGKFEPREIKIGLRGSNYSEVLSGISEGEKVVTNGNFLLDSESSLKAAFSGGHEH